MKTIRYNPSSPGSPAFYATLLMTLVGLLLPAAVMAAGQEAEAATEEAEATEEEPETYSNTIRWATASEVDNFGFEVFRSESADGPFERLNSKIIEGAGTVDEPQKYEWVDDTIDPHKTYFYYVESISMSGVREKFTPVGKAGPKIKPETEESEESAEEASSSDEEG